MFLAVGLGDECLCPRGVQVERAHGEAHHLDAERLQCSDLPPYEGVAGARVGRDDVGDIHGTARGILGRASPTAELVTRSIVECVGGAGPEILQLGISYHRHPNRRTGFEGRMPRTFTTQAAPDPS